MQGKQSSGPNSSDEALQAKLDAIRKEKQQQAASPAQKAHSELSDKINKIVKSIDRQAPDSLDIALQHRLKAMKTAKAQPAALRNGVSATDLQDQINAIVGSHAKSLKHQRVLVSDPTALASPSPAKSFSDVDFESHANLALSNAKERATPGKSPSALRVHWEGYENHSAPVAWPTYECDFSPCQLSFADGFETFNPLVAEYDIAMPKFTPYEEEIAPCQLSFADAPQKVAVPAVLVEPETCTVQPKEDFVVAAKVEPRPFDLSEIPSPTRNRAKREQWASVKDEAAKADEAASVEAQLLQEKKAKQAADEMEERLRMDKVCVDTFLESVNTCAWRERVRTPIKGSNLYVKHIRPCRPAGTSVDVKDSSFMNLGNFLCFLEGEGLLRLKPGMSDPVVNEIRFDACSNYQYVPRGSPMQLAPHDAGCACRKCTPAMASWQ